MDNQNPQITHVFNEELKRLEPVDPKCIYCGVRHSKSMDTNYFFPLYKENDRTNLLVYRSVKYKIINIGVSRCPRCMQIHKFASSIALLYSWGIGLFVACLFIVLYIQLDNFLFLLPVIPGSIFAGFGGYQFFVKKIVRSKGILTKKDGAMRCAIVRELVKAGWTFNQPTA